VFVACDYDSAELRTLGQVLLDRFGESALADAFRSDPSFDPHLAFAERLTSSRDAAELKIWRQRAKAANFGFPGGLGVRAFLAYALGYGVRLSLAQAEDIREGWFEQWPQMKDYFSINGRRARASCSRVVHERSCRIRADCTFTQLCNTPFQGMTADAALHALWEVTKRCYGDSSSSLFGSRPVIFVHDEIVVEVPESRVDDVVRELPKVMTEAARRFVPDVPMTCKATAQRLWSKDAQHVEDAFGRVVPWVKTDSTPLLIRPGMV
jgi:DNA polymerase-1